MEFIINNDTNHILPSSYSYKLSLAGIVQINQYGSNVYFTISSTGGSRVFSWYEGNGVYWVNIGKELLISSTVVIFANVGDLSENYFNSSTGCFALLSTTYGINDTGFKVFQFYDNFVGTSLSSSWMTITTGAGTYSVNNGITVSENAYRVDMRVVTKSTYNNGILEAYINSQNTASFRGTGLEYNTILPNSSGNNGQYGYRWMTSANAQPGNFIQSIVNGSDDTLVSLGHVSSTSNYFLTADWNETGYVAWFNNHSSTALLSVYSSTVNYSSTYLVIYAGSDGSNIGTIGINFIRFRTSFANESPSITFKATFNFVSDLSLSGSTKMATYGFNSSTNTLSVVPESLNLYSSSNFSGIITEKNQIALYEGFFDFPSNGIGVVPPRISILEFVDSFFEGLLPTEHIYDLKAYDLVRQKNVAVLWIDDLEQSYIGFGNESWGDYVICADVYLIGQNTDVLLDNIVSNIHRRIANFEGGTPSIELDKVVWVKLENEENFQSSVRGATKYRFDFAIRVYINELFGRRASEISVPFYMNISGVSSTNVSTSYSSTILVNVNTSSTQINDIMLSNLKKVI